MIVTLRLNQITLLTRKTALFMYALETGMKAANNIARVEKCKSLYNHKKLA